MAKTTIQDWEDMNLPMVWSVYSGELATEYGNTELDLSAPEGMPDGAFSVTHGGVVGLSTVFGVEVQDGYIVPGPSARAMFRAVCLSEDWTDDEIDSGEAQTDHIFVEFLKWDSESNTVQVFTGS